MDRHQFYNTHGLLLLFIGVAVALLYRMVQTDSRDRSAWWFGGATASAGMSLLVLSHSAGRASDFAASFLFLAALPLLHIAVGSAARENTRRTLPWAIAVMVAGFLAFTVVGSARVALFCVPVVEAMTLWLLLRKPNSVTRMANLAMALFLSLHIVLFTLRMHMVVSGKAQTGILAYGGMLSAVGIAVSFVAMEGLRSRYVFERLAMTDPLTGLLNRRALDLVAPREVQRCIREGLPCSALMLDIDRFKEINDTMGHAAGDASLQAVAALLQTVLRQTDVITRHGGDEFFVLLPNCGHEDAAMLLARLRQAASACTVVNAGGERFAIGISFGMTTQTGPTMTVQDLQHASDVVLYREKHLSRQFEVGQGLPDELDGGAQVQPSNA